MSSACQPHVAAPRIFRLDLMTGSGRRQGRYRRHRRTRRKSKNIDDHCRRCGRQQLDRVRSTGTCSRPGRHTWRHRERGSRVATFGIFKRPRASNETCRRFLSLPVDFVPPCPEADSELGAQHWRTLVRIFPQSQHITTGFEFMHSS